jgi:hypothetical protein
VLAQKEQKNVKEKTGNYLVFHENLLKNAVLTLKVSLCVHHVRHINIVKFIYYNYEIKMQQWLLIVEQLYIQKI